MDAAEQYAALRRGVGAVHLDRDVLRVSGPDAVEYLQGQLSQDIAPLDVGDSVLSFLLEPQGKVVVLLRVTRLTDDTLLLDTDAGYGESMRERLQRFKLRTKIDIEPLDWRGIGLRGPDASGHAAVSVAGGVTIDASWPGLPGIDLLGPDPAVPAEVPLCDEMYETTRIEAGMPRMGLELTEKTIPHETGVISVAVSLTKGCYTGQELVARVDSRGGNVPRHLHGVVIEGDAPPAGAAVLVKGDDAGLITSSAPRPDGTSVALAYIRRGHVPPFAANVSWDDRSVAARVEPLPLVG